MYSIERTGNGMVCVVWRDPAVDKSPHALPPATWLGTLKRSFFHLSPAPLSYLVTGMAQVIDTTVGPDFEEIFSQGNIGGYEFERTNEAVTLGGWARADETSNAALFMVGFGQLVQIKIQAGPGENDLDPITIQIHTKAYVIPGVFGHDVYGVSFDVTGLPSGMTIDRTIEDAGWTRTSESFEVKIGDIIGLSTAGNATVNGLSAVTTRGQRA